MIFFLNIYRTFCFCSLRLNLQSWAPSLATSCLLPSQPALTWRVWSSWLTTRTPTEALTSHSQVRIDAVAAEPKKKAWQKLHKAFFCILDCMCTCAGFCACTSPRSLTNHPPCLRASCPTSHISSLSPSDCKCVRSRTEKWQKKKKKTCLYCLKRDLTSK